MKKIEMYTAWTSRLSRWMESLGRRRWVHHVIPILAFLILAGIYNGHRTRLYHKDPENRTKSFTFYKTFVAGKYDQGIYRGIGVAGYDNGKRVGWYPGAAIPGGLLWRLMGRPMEKSGNRLTFYLCFFIPSLIAGIGFFYCFYRIALNQWGVKVGIVSLLSLVAYPSSFYTLTYFPYNYALLCMTGYILIFDSEVRGRYFWLGLVAFFCALTYPSAVLFGIYPVLRELEVMFRRKGIRILPSILYGLPFVLGVFAFFLHLYFVRGDFFAYLTHQSSHFERDFSHPLEAILVYFREMPLHSPENVTALYVIFFMALFACKNIGVAMWGYMIVILAFSPLTGSFQCVYRHYLLAFPLHYMFGLSTKKWNVKLLFVLLCLYLGLRPFFAYYIKGQLT